MAFGGKAKETTANGHATAPDAEAGYEMGSARGGGSDGAGSYEMVGMAPKDQG